MSNFLTGGWEDVTFVPRNELVFADRNKDYGAYELRMKYGKNVLMAVAFSVGTFVLAISAPTIMSWFESGDVDDAPKQKIVTITELAPPPPMNEKVLPPPEMKLPELKQVKFVEPEIKLDEEVVDEPPPVIEDLKKADVSTVTTDGADVTYNIQEPVVNEVIEDESNKVFMAAEQMPEFPDGVDAMYNFIKKNLIYPPLAAENEVQGRVIIGFVVNQDGSITDIKVLRDIGSGCGAEAMRVVKKMPPWKAGKQNGKPVKVQFSLPVIFELN